jgi:hypothetical protein
MFEIFCSPVGIPLSGAEWTDCRTRASNATETKRTRFPKQLHGRMDVRKARMSLFGEKKNKNERKLERDLLCDFPNGSN